MASRGFLIRFIDIGLIVLFGFLMISDIEAASRVELADSRPAEEEVAPEEAEAPRAFVLVEIGGDGTFTVSDPAEGEAPVRLPGAEALEAELRRRQALRPEGVETVVLIQPDPASVVQLTVDAMDVADRLSLAKSLRMDIEIAPPPESLPAVPRDSVAPGDSGAVAPGDSASGPGGVS